MAQSILITPEEFVHLMDRIDSLEKSVRAYAETSCAPKVLRVKDIAKIERISVSQITTKEAYLLPRFGISAYPDGVCRWPMQEYLTWSSRPVEERKREWMRALRADAQRYVDKGVRK